MGRLGWAFAWVAVVVVALSLRLPGLASRPFHTDEGTNAYLLDALVRGEYRYPGHDHHGPVLYYAALLPLKATGHFRLADWTGGELRTVTLAAGVALCLLPLLLVPWLGRFGSWAAGLLLAAAAPLAYYSGVFIHETLLVLFVGLFAAAFWRVRETGSMTWSCLAGVAAGLALATKETAGVMLPVLALTCWPGTHVPARRQLLLSGLALVLCLATVAAFFSNFGRNPEDAWALFRAAGLQVGRGTGEEHAYPWWQYLAWFGRSSPLGTPWTGWVLGGALLAALLFLHDRPLVKGFGLAGVLLTIFFFLLPYKTPWLTLAGWTLSAWLAGALLGELFERSRLLASATLVALVGLLSLESGAKVLSHPVDPANPLAYSPTSPDVFRLENDLSALAKSRPEGPNLLIQVVARDYWPLPWVLRRFPQTGYWTDPTPLHPEATGLLSPDYAASEPDRAAMKSYALRPGVLIFLRPPKS